MSSNHHLWVKKTYYRPRVMGRSFQKKPVGQNVMSSNCCHWKKVRNKTFSAKVFKSDSFASLQSPRFLSEPANHQIWQNLMGLSTMLVAKK